MYTIKDKIYIKRVLNNFLIIESSYEYLHVEINKFFIVHCLHMHSSDIVSLSHIS